MASIRNMSLGTKLILIIFVVLAVSTVSTIVLLNRNAARLMEQAGRAQLESEADAIQSGFIQTEDQVLTIVQLLATSPGLVDAVIERDPTAVRTIVLTTAATSSFDEIDVVDIDGNSLTESSRTGAFENLLSLGLLGIKTTGIVVDPDTQELMLSGVISLRDSGGSIVGALVAGQTLDEEYLAAITRNRDDIHLALIHQEEVVVATEGSHEDYTAAAFSPRLLQEARSGKWATDNEVRYDSDGVPHVQAIIPIGTQKTSEDTFLAAYVDLSRLHSFQQQVLLFVAAGIGLSGLAVIGLIALFAWRGIGLPLGQLQTVAETMAGGNYDQRVEGKGQDEIGRLGSAFNVMAQAVQQRQSELQELTATLESRVKQRTQDLEQANREVREASRLKDEFLAVMSHELRTPLNAIIGFQGILEMMGNLDEKNLHRVRRTRANAERLLHLIDDVLDISRIESGRLQIVPSPVTIRELVDRLHKQIDVLAAEKGLVFNVEIDEDMPPVVWADEDSVTKIITNLLGNAIKFTAEGQVELHIGCEDHNWEIRVSDTGVGIPAHMQEIIFERFRQVDGSTKREYGGSGLGLAIARQLSMAMGGNIRVESTPGEGAMFMATLPLVLPPEVEPAATV